MKTRLTLASPRVSIPILVFAFCVCLVTMGWGTMSTSTIQRQPRARKAPTYAATKPVSRLSYLQSSTLKAGGPATVAESLTPHLLNLTNSPATQKMPAWSPQGETFAFISNGTDENGDGTIDTVNADPSYYYLYTMSKHGTELTWFKTLKDYGSVNGLAWQPDGLAIYVSLRETTGQGTIYTIRKVDITSGDVSDPIMMWYKGKSYQPTAEIGNLVVAGNNTVIFFEMKTDLTSPLSNNNLWNIYNVATRGGVLGQLTSGSNNRHPVLVDKGQLLLYDSDQLLDPVTGVPQRSIFSMTPNGTQQSQVLVPPSGAEDYQPQKTADGRYFVFSSTRPTDVRWNAPDTRAPKTDNYPEGRENIWALYVTPPTPPDLSNYRANLPKNPRMFGEPGPRFYPDVTLNFQQHDPAVQIFEGNSSEMLFVSNKDSASDNIWLGACYDHEAPFVSTPVTLTNKIMLPGDTAHISVQVTDIDSGVSHVWIQIKNPNSAATDWLGQNHVITMPSGDVLTALNGDDYEMPFSDGFSSSGDNSADAWYIYEKTNKRTGTPMVDPVTKKVVPAFPTSIPVEFEPIDLGDPASATYNQYIGMDTDGKHPELSPDYFAFSDSRNDFYNADTEKLDIAYVAGNPYVANYANYQHEGEGYPKVAPYWAEMKDSGNGIYTYDWQTPADQQSDWYIDIIVEDNNPVYQDPDDGTWHGLRRRFDNVGGCSTVMNFTSGGHLLLVDDFADGQRFEYYGVGGVIDGYLDDNQHWIINPLIKGMAFDYGIGNVGHRNMPYYFENVINPDRYSNTYDMTPYDTSPFVPQSLLGGCQLWRLLCRGPVPDDVLKTYLPRSIRQVDPTDRFKPAYVSHGDKAVVWVSPTAYFQLNSTWSADGDIEGSGSLVEQTTQDRLRDFVDKGGRLFVIGPQLPIGLTREKTVENKFQEEVLGADYNATVPYLTPGDIMSWQIVPTPQTGPHHHFEPGLVAVPNWYGMDLYSQKWNMWGEYYTASDPSDPVALFHAHHPFGVYHYGHVPPLNTPGHLLDDPGVGPILPYYGHPGRDINHDHDVLPINENPNVATLAWFGEDDATRALQSFIIGEDENSTTNTNNVQWDLYWDPLTLYAGAPKARKAFICWDTGWGGDSWTWHNFATDDRYIVGVSNEYGKNTGRSIYWTFGYHDLAVTYRNRPTWDSLEWLLDGSVAGHVMQNNPLGPVGGALVLAMQNGQVIMATVTNPDGSYLLQGLRPGRWGRGGYELFVIANGYSGNTMDEVEIIGAKTLFGYDFYLTREVNNASLSGYVTLRGTLVSGATITATPIAGTGTYTTTSQADGFYTIPNLPFGQYRVTAVHPLTKQITTVVPDPDLKAGQNLHLDIELAEDQPDLLVKAQSDTTYIGDGIYNDLSKQTVKQLAEPPATATYDIQLKNAGNTPQQMVLSSSAIETKPGWTVTYYETNNGNITDAITGAQGWTTPDAIDVNGTIDIEVQVTPDNTVAPDDLQPIIITAAEARDPSIMDQVEMDTQRPGPLQGATLSVDPPSPSPVRTNITLTATSSGGSGPISYQFRLKNPGEADYNTVLQDWAASASCVWTPLLPSKADGTPYGLEVVAKDTVSGDTATATTVYQVTSKPLTQVTLSTNPQGSGFSNQPVQLIAIPDGGADLRFKFTVAYHDASGKAVFLTLQDFGTSSTCTWTPTYATTYNFQVTAKDLLGTGNVATNGVTSQIVQYKVNIPPLHEAILTGTPVSPIPINTPVTLAVDTHGGGINNNYKFVTGTSTVIRNYNSSSTCVWTPKTPGTYQFKAYVEDLGSTTPTVEYPSNDLVYTVTNPLAGVKLAVGSSSPQMINTPIKLTASATGGANVQYRFKVNDIPVADFGPLASYMWTPSSAGSYTLAVEAKDINGSGTVFTSNKVNFTIVSALTGVMLDTTPASPVVAKTPVQLTATPMGGVMVYYQFMVGAAVVQNYTSSNTMTWTPNTAGIYQVTVNAYDLYDANPNNVVSITKTFTVNNGVSKVVLNANPASPRPVNTPIQLSATATGGAKLVYQFLADNTPLTNFVTSNAFQWTPNVAKTYNLSVVVKDLNSPNPTTGYSSTVVPYTVVSSLSAATITATPAAPRPANSSITLTAGASGGANCIYKFMADQTMIRDFSASPTCNWIPTDAGTYALTVIIRDLSGADPTREVTSPALSYEISSALAGVTLAANPSPFCPKNVPMTLTASPDGGSQVSYRFMNGTKILRDFNTSPTFTWTPTTVGSCQLTVVAKDLNSTGTAQVTSTPVTVTITQPITNVSLNTSLASPCTVNAQVTLIASVTGGANVLYKFMEGNTVVRDFDPSPNCIWSPTYTGMYNLSVVAEDISVSPPQVKATAPISFSVVNPLSSLTLTASPASSQPVNTHITLTAQAVGGAKLEYRFIIDSAPDGTPTLLQDFGSASTCIWTPTVGGTYNLRVAVRDRSGENPVVETYATLTYEIQQDPGALTVDLSVSPVSGTVGSPATLTAISSIPTGVQYRFRAGYQDQWRRWRWMDIQQYSASASCNWIPATATSYTLVVWARKNGSSKAYDATASQQYVVNVRKK